jgi:hypothetical protein
MAFDQGPVVDEGVDRQQLDRGDAERLEMRDDAGLRQRRDRAAQRRATSSRCMVKPRTCSS